MSLTEFKRTKILATIGPASFSGETIEQLLTSGVNGFRMNFSHGEHSERLEQLKWIRDASAKHDRPVAVVQDIQGPKIRLGVFNDDQSFEVKTGDELILDFEGKFNGRDVIPVQYNLASKVKVGQAVYMFDGKVKSEVIDIPSDTAIKVKILNDGAIRQKKGLNLPDTDMGGDILTEKDIKDLEFGATQDYDYVAASFIQTAEDVENLRQMMAFLDYDAQIIAKIETKSAIKPENMEEIVEAADAIMVARGDLAVEAGPEVVPVVQQQLVDLCRKHGKIIIVATQMMSSMVQNPEPTRAEVSDVANAVIQGVDVVMLSDETAQGEYPVQAVRAMNDVIMYTQNNTSVICPIVEIKDVRKEIDVLTSAAVEMAEQIDADAIIVGTRSGVTAARMAAKRPNRAIISATSNKRVAQQLALTYANKTCLMEASRDVCVDLARKLKKDGWFGSKDEVTVVVTNSSDPELLASTDTIAIRKV